MKVRRNRRNNGYTRHREIAGFRKGREVNYSTSVTVTKGEQILIWVCVLLFLCGVLAALFLFKSVLAMIISIGGGILLIFGVMVFCIFRPKHREERKQNAVVSGGKVDEVWCNLPGVEKHTEQQGENDPALQYHGNDLQ